MFKQRSTDVNIYTTPPFGQPFKKEGKLKLNNSTIQQFNNSTIQQPNTMVINSQEELATVAQDLLKKHANERVFGFFGEMGAGKTTLIKEICRQLGVTATTSSPTFAIVNEYFTNQDEAVYHFDFYRINSIDEAVKIGFDDYLYSGNYCFIEWTEKVEELLADDYVRVDIRVLDDGKREFKY